MVDHAAQAGILIASLLGSRGEQGATQEEVEKVILWARGVHAEAAEVATLAKRPRLRKADASTERIAASDLNRALLDGILNSTLVVDVDPNGQLLFRSV